MAKTHEFITDFDSSTSMFFALSHFLKGKDFSGVGITPDFPGIVSDAINAVPGELRTALYRWSGWAGAIADERVHEVCSENISEWVVGQYPKRQYPAVMIGSSNGAATNLAAALGIPWLPQTYLLSVRRTMHPDEVRKDAEWGKKIVRRFLPHNPDLLAYQMHDPLQDRLMIEKMGYFRLKKTKLDKPLKDFIKANLKTGGTLLTIECNYKWLLYRLGDRHTFQIGGLGGLTPQEYLEGCPEINKFLKPYDSKVKKWNLDGEPVEGEEAEWGFVAGLYDDVKTFAKENGYKIKRICFAHPEDLSFVVADLYQWWYRKLGRKKRQLLVECFALLEPLWTIKTGCIPFWLAFNTISSAENLEKYIKDSKSFHKIFLMLMSNGVENAIGLTPIERWKDALNQAQHGGELIGVDENKYPADFGVFLKYHQDLKNKIKDRLEMPSPLRLGELNEFLKERKGKYCIEWK